MTWHIRQPVCWLLMAVALSWLAVVAVDLRAAGPERARLHPTAAQERWHTEVASPSNDSALDLDQQDETAQQSQVKTNESPQSDAPEPPPETPTSETSRPIATPMQQESSDSADTPASAAPRVPRDPKSYDLWTITPAIVAILLAIFFRQVIPALVVGVLVGAYMMLPCRPTDDLYTQMNAVVGGFRLATERYVLGVIHDNPSPADAFNKISIMVFTLVIGFMVGVIGHNGGTAGMVKLVTGQSASQRRGALTAWFAGMVVFFDDYANTMIIGPTMRPVFDRLKLSRAKLAYIVDSTAAPVASIALIGTWIGAEIGFIQEGLNSVIAAGPPEFLIRDDGTIPHGMQVFIHSIPYRYYALLALFMVFLVSLTGRDFGPMKRAQRRAAALPSTKSPPSDPRASGRVDLARRDTHGPTGASTQNDDGSAPPRWWLGLVPVLTLVAVTIAVLVITGLGSEKTQETFTAVAAGGQSKWAEIPMWEKASTIISNADAYQSILYGAILSAFAAVLLTILARAVSTVESITAGVNGMCRMFPAIVILVLAWSLSQVLQDLTLGQIASEHLKAAQFNVRWLPLAVFITAAVISFSTGTSWGTMGILCPTVVLIAAHLAAGIDPAEALTLFYAAVGSVLAGAVFGDHCSPISDTTVLSAIASECTIEEHVWTQLPYALVTAFAAMAVGDVMSSAYNQPWYYGLGAGAIVVVLIVFIFGRKSPPETNPAPQPLPTTI
jgi:Na+/H+ antiporter NhaC